MTSSMPEAGENLPTPTDMNHYYTFRATVDEIVRADELLVNVDLGFSITKEVCLSLFGIDAPDPHTTPDDSNESRRGIRQRDFVETWVGAARSTYSGNDGLPLSVTTMRSRDGNRNEFEAIVFSRATGDSLNDQIRAQFPEVAEL